MRNQTLRFLVVFLLVSSLSYAPPPAASDDELVLGVFPRRDVASTTRLFTPLADHLSQAIGRTVVLKTPRDFETFWEELRDQRYDLVHYNQYQYLKSAADLGYRVILKNSEFGSDEISGAIIVNVDSDIEDLTDLRGKRIVFGGGPTAMMSYIVPKYLLQGAGVVEGEYETEFSQNPSSALFAVYYGHADAAGVGDVATRIKSVTEKIDVSRLRVLAKSEPVAHIAWAVSDEMDLNEATKVQQTLAALGDTPAGASMLEALELDGLLPATDDDYDPHRRIVWEALGENYCVRNCAEFKEGVVTTKNPEGALVMGVFPRRPRKLTQEMFAPLADYLQAALQRPVELVVPKDFDAFWKGVTEHQFDIVHYNQYQYVKSHKLYEYRAILINEEQKVSRVRPVIWVRTDSGHESLKDLKGGKIIFGGGKTAMMTYIGPTALLRNAGLGSEDYEEVFAINPVAGCKAMYLGQADACGAGDIMFRLPVLADQVDVSQVRILEQGDPLEFLVWAVRNTMDAGTREKVQSILSGLDADEAGQVVLKSMRMSGLRTVDDGDFDPHRELIRFVLDERY